MSWATLGSLSPIYDWRFFDLVSIGGSVFRILQTWDGENPGRILVRSQFGDNVSAEVIVIYPSTDPQVFVFRQDEELLKINLGVRYLQCRMPNGVRVYENTNWIVTLQEWVG